MVLVCLRLCYAMMCYAMICYNMLCYICSAVVPRVIQRTWSQLCSSSTLSTTERLKVGGVTCSSLWYREAYPILLFSMLIVYVQRQLITTCLNVNSVLHFVVQGSHQEFLVGKPVYCECLISISGKWPYHLTIQ